MKICIEKHTLYLKALRHKVCFSIKKWMNIISNQIHIQIEMQVYIDTIKYKKSQLSFNLVNIIKQCISNKRC